VSFDPDTRLRFQLFAVNAWRGSLYVLAVHNESGAMFLDAYSTRTGKYQYSMRIPVSRCCAPVFVTDDTVLSRCASGLVRLTRADSAIVSGFIQDANSLMTRTVNRALARSDYAHPGLVRGHTGSGAQSRLEIPRRHQTPVQCRGRSPEFPPCRTDSPRGSG